MARGPLQLACRHLPAGRENGRGVLVKEGEDGKGRAVLVREVKCWNMGLLLAFILAVEVEV